MWLGIHPSRQANNFEQYTFESIPIWPNYTFVLVNFSCELGILWLDMTKEASKLILSYVRTNSNLT